MGEVGRAGKSLTGGFKGCKEGEALTPKLTLLGFQRQWLGRRGPRLHMLFSSLCSPGTSARKHSWIPLFQASENTPPHPKSWEHSEEEEGLFVRRSSRKADKLVNILGRGLGVARRNWGKGREGEWGQEEWGARRMRHRESGVQGEWGTGTMRHREGRI